MNNSPSLADEFASCEDDDAKLLEFLGNKWSLVLAALRRAEQMPLCVYRFEALDEQCDQSEENHRGPGSHVPVYEDVQTWRRRAEAAEARADGLAEFFHEDGHEISDLSTTIAAQKVALDVMKALAESYLECSAMFIDDGQKRIDEAYALSLPAEERKYTLREIARLAALRSGPIDPDELREAVRLGRKEYAEHIKKCESLGQPTMLEADYLVVRKRDDSPLECWLFCTVHEAEERFEFASHQWNEVFMCAILRGPGPQRKRPQVITQVNASTNEQPRKTRGVRGEFSEPFTPGQY